MDTNEVFRVQDAILILAGSIDNFSSIVLTLKSNDLAKGILDRRIIALDEVAVDELHRQGRLACKIGLRDVSLALFLFIFIYFLFLAWLRDMSYIIY